MAELKNNEKNIQIIYNIKTKIINHSKYIFNELVKRNFHQIKSCKKYNSNNKNKINKLNKNIFHIIIIFLLLIIFSKEIKITKINFFSEITITIKGANNQNILSNMSFTSNPTQIFI